MKQNIAAFVAGFVFAIGLVIAKMTNPEKVLAFLDVVGKWDPSLAFVMVGAIGVYSISYRFIVKRSAPIWGLQFAIPTAKNIDKKLLSGAFLFGIGWGIAGFCPGPAIVNLASLQTPVFVFFVAMVMGAFAFKLTDSWIEGQKLQEK